MSYDHEDDALTVEWFSDIDGNLGAGGTVTPSLSNGRHTITMRATDDSGAYSTDQVTVTVGETMTRGY